MFTRIKNIGGPFWFGVSLVALSALHLLFAIRTNVYFSQDDFAVLAYFKNHTTWEMIGQFLTQGDMWDFRKIVGYLNLRLLFDLWQVNPLAYLINNHLWHTLNVLLVFLSVHRLRCMMHRSIDPSMDQSGRGWWVAWVAAVVFNKMYLAYFSNIHEYLVTFFSLLAGYLFLRRVGGWWLATAAAAAVLTKEVGVTAMLYLLGLAWVSGQPLARVIPAAAVVAGYGFYQANFWISRFHLLGDHPYVVSWKLNWQFYLNWTGAVVLAAITWLRKRTTVGMLAASGVALLPALLLSNRQETYYGYLPWAYFSVWLGSCLPRLTRRTLVVYLVGLYLLGGRQILPPLAWQTYPNWQKESIRWVVAEVENGRLNFPPQTLERDAYLMLGSQVVDLFLPATVSAQYRFHYNLDTYDLEMVKR